ncbi:hypothetical protein [Thiosulfatihalobacter marinus]|uniref:hypothetical protein n=1 Tax=Thiosulfatihalobacter marinus TaxID=2792481 RepID=UPI0018D826C5|nr:hypothetical protein [Thiosulfatihalobacter marinus]
MSKPIEFYLAIGAATAYVLNRAKDHTIIQRTIMAGVSYVLAYSLSEDVAAMVGWSEAIVGVIIATLAYPILDIATAFVSDRALIFDILKGRLKK